MHCLKFNSREFFIKLQGEEWTYLQCPKQKTKKEFIALQENFGLASFHAAESFKLLEIQAMRWQSTWVQNNEEWESVTFFSNQKNGSKENCQIWQEERRRELGLPIWRFWSYPSRATWARSFCWNTRQRWLHHISIVQDGVWSLSWWHVWWTNDLHETARLNRGHVRRCLRAQT